MNTFIRNMRFGALMTACLIWLNTNMALADSDHSGEGLTSSAHKHAPLGVMGDHMHNKGEFMLSYRYMHMDMQGNRSGTSSIDPDTIATTLVNPYGPPATVRVVPTDMQMGMHMVGGMYAPIDDLTLMIMGMYHEKSMDHLTYMGMAGTTIRGSFTTESKGWGDTKVGGLYRLYTGATHNVHLNLGVSLPTGSIKQTDTVLAPNGMTPTLRLPYGMQLGTGTYDLLPGITYQGYDGDWNWGAQYSAEIRLEDENDQGYSWGDRHQITAWGAYQWAPWVSTSLRLTAWTQDEIDGRDTNIAAPVHTANPDNYGGNFVDAGIGVNFIIPEGPLVNHRLAIEANVPVHRDVNGVQLEKDWGVTLGWQYAF